MSQLSSKAIEEFRVIWKKNYGRELLPEEAAIRAAEVFTVIRLALESPAAGRGGVTPEAASDPLERLERMRTEILL